MAMDMDSYGYYPLVNVYITMEHHHAIHGQINYFYGQFSIANCDKLPEGMAINYLKKPGWWLSPTPLNNMSSSVGMMTFPIYGKNIPNVPNHQSENIWLKDWQKEFLIVQIKAMAMNWHSSCHRLLVGW